MSNPAERIIPRMQATRDELLASIDGLDAETLTWCPSGGGWTIQENLAHLVDAEGGHRRFVQAVLAGQTTRVEDIDLDRWNEERVARRCEQTVGGLIEALGDEREQTLAVVAGIPDDAWEKRGHHRGPFPSASGF